MRNGNFNHDLYKKNYLPPKTPVNHPNRDHDDYDYAYIYIGVLFCAGGPDTYETYNERRDHNLDRDFHSVLYRVNNRGRCAGNSVAVLYSY